jgi:hypothetical protein
MDIRRNRRKWRNIVAHPGFQLKLALSHCAFVVAVVFVLVASLLSTFYLDVQGSNDLWARYASAELLWRVFGRFGSAILLILAISAVYHVIFSHRLCGPLVNIRHSIERITEGDVTRKVFLRRADFLKEEAAAINSMLTNLDERISSLKTIHSEIAFAVRQMPQEPEGDRVQTLLDEQERLLDKWVVSTSASEMKNEKEQYTPPSVEKRRLGRGLVR